MHLNGSSFFYIGWLQTLWGTTRIRPLVYIIYINHTFIICFYLPYPSKSFKQLLYATTLATNIEISTFIKCFKRALISGIQNYWGGNKSYHTKNGIYYLSTNRLWYKKRPSWKHKISFHLMSISYINSKLCVSQKWFVRIKTGGDLALLICI